jgi:hypothetical protein
MMTEVAHLGQGKSENNRRLVSIISFPSSRFLLSDSGDVGHHSADVGHPGMVACSQPAVEPAWLRERLIHSRSRFMALRRI